MVSLWWMRENDSFVLTIIPAYGLLESYSCSNSDHDEDAAEEDTNCTGWNKDDPVRPWIDEVRGHAGGWFKRRSCKQFGSLVAFHSPSLITFAFGSIAAVIPLRTHCTLSVVQENLCLPPGGETSFRCFQTMNSCSNAGNHSSLDK